MLCALIVWLSTRSDDRLPSVVFRSGLLTKHHEVPLDSLDDGVNFAIFYPLCYRHIHFQKNREILAAKFDVSLVQRPVLRRRLSTSAKVLLFHCIICKLVNHFLGSIQKPIICQSFLYWYTVTAIAHRCLLILFHDIRVLQPI